MASWAGQGDESLLLIVFGDTLLISFQSDIWQKENNRRMARGDYRKKRAEGAPVEASSPDLARADEEVAAPERQGSAEIERTLKAHCEDEWGNDFQMRAFCEGQQREAVSELGRVLESKGGMPQATFDDVLARCVSEWPSDYQMLAFCLRQQIEGYEAVNK